MADGVLAIVGKSTPLSQAQALALASVLTPADPDHLWPAEISSGQFGCSRANVLLTKVKPMTVVEVLADMAMQAGAFRHPVRYVRHRPDLTVEDVAP